MDNQQPSIKGSTTIEINKCNSFIENKTNKMYEESRVELIQFEMEGTLKSEDIVCHS